MKIHCENQLRPTGQKSENKKYNTTVSYCQGCIDYGRSKFTEDKGFQTKNFPLTRSVEPQTEVDTYLQGISSRYTKLSSTRTILQVRNNLIILLET